MFSFECIPKYNLLTPNVKGQFQYSTGDCREVTLYHSFLICSIDSVLKAQRDAAVSVEKGPKNSAGAIGVRARTQTMNIVALLECIPKYTLLTAGSQGTIERYFIKCSSCSSVGTGIEQPKRGYLRV